MAESTEYTPSSWSDRGAYWARTAPKGESQNDAPNQFLIEKAAIVEGATTLDIASGAGEPAISIAITIGPAGSVTAYDANSEMLQGARNRAAALNLDQMHFEIGNMESLPFDDEQFDAVTCRFGLMFPEDPVAALSETRRVLKPGKLAAYMVHGRPENNTLYMVLRNTVRDALGQLEETGNSRRFLYSHPGELSDLFEQAGFTDVGEHTFNEIVNRSGEGRFWDTMLQRSMGAQIEGMSANDMDRLNDALAEAFAPYRVGDHYELSSSEQAAWGRA